MRPLFLYGTLLHEPLFEVVAGTGAKGIAAHLEDHGVYWAGEAGYPRIADKGPGAAGILIEPGSARARIDFFEAGFGYGARAVTVMTAEGPRKADVYWPGADVPEPGAPFDLSDWVARHAPLAINFAREAMEYFGEISPELLRARRAPIEARAWAKVNAADAPAPPELKKLPVLSVDVARRERPYSNYFSILEEDLSYTQFDGSMGATVNRAAFIGFDAVVVLPYDPVRDRVHLIEQFRLSPYFRGDPHCFVLEAVAGRIDAGETPEETARREVREEAGLEVLALHPVSANYPSTSAFTEYIYTFLAIADLPDGSDAMGGVDEEHEDIRGHLLDYAEFDALLAEDRFNAGPLILAGHWLARNRDHLRRDALGKA